MCKLQHDMHRWVVENQIGVKDLCIDECDARQTVYIFGCKDSVLQIKGIISVLLSLIAELTYLLTMLPFVQGKLTT